jgi:predicted helicase
VISVIGVVERKGFSVLAADHVPNLHLTDTGQCFPLYWYERIGSAVDESEDGPASSDLFHDQSIGSHEEADEAGYIRRDAISDSALNEFRIGCEDSSIGKEDLFYYVYGVLHAPSYRTKFDASLRKVLPRIPMPAGAAAFWAFSRAGRALAALHIGYESVEPFPLQEEVKGLALDAKEFYRVEKMAFAKNSKAIDKSAIVFNSRVRLSGIPLEAYEYVVNGKSAIEWVMERYAVTLDKESGIRNDPNDWSDDPRYVVDLVRRVVRVSIETVRIVNSLPAIG